jgi:hemerythrin
MSFIEWTAEWELNIPEIDEQHKRIVDYINELHLAIKYQDQEQVLVVAERVVEYTYEHFEYEEGLLEKSGYEMLDAHIATHERFKKKALEMKNSIAGDDIYTEARKMRSELTLWLLNHIKREDSNYVKNVEKLFKKKSFFWHKK